MSKELLIFSDIEKAMQLTMAAAGIPMPGQPPPIASNSSTPIAPPVDDDFAPTSGAESDAESDNSAPQQASIQIEYKDKREASEAFKQLLYDKVKFSI